MPASRALLFVLSGLIGCAAMAEPAATGIEGVINLSPSHGGPIRPGITNSRPLASTEFVVENESGAVASFTTDSEGKFSVTVPPGHYRVSKKDKQHRIGRFGPFEVEVIAGQMAKVQWTCDSGMR